MHPLVEQLHFARAEFRRCLEGISEADAVVRLTPMNCISWMVGHLALQEYRYWVIRAQSRELATGLFEAIGVNQPATTPSLAEMWAEWHSVTDAADKYLLSLTADDLTARFSVEGRPVRESIGTMLYRNIYHYWFHTGEAHAVRQQLGHGELPQFVGALPVYRPPA
jgi:uncharacterized damage-inducible protein DinB